MKLFKSLLAIFYILGCQAFAQNGKILYRETYVTDITDPIIIMHELYFNKTKSLYLQILNKDEPSEKISYNDDGTFNITYKSTWEIPMFVLRDLTVSKYIFRNHAGSKMPTVNEEPFIIDWKLHNETKKIGNYTVQKATATFRGRNYTAWFAPDIPTPFGPWKLTGLSGLIIEASEDSGMYKVEAIQINIIAESDNDVIADKLKHLKLDNIIEIDEYITLIEDEARLSNKSMKSKLPRGVEISSDNKKDYDPYKYRLEIFNEF